MTNLTAKAWLTIATGGRWTVPELNDALPEIQRKQLQKSLENMLIFGSVTRYEGDKVAYGVTPDCTIPRGVSVSQILSVLGVAQ